MSELDRLSNSGVYPALPIADQRRRQESERRPLPDPRAQRPESPAGSGAEAGQPRPPKSIIDEYA